MSPVESPAHSLGKTHDLDTTKAETELGMTWSDIDDSIRQQALFLDEKGHLGKQ